MLKSLKLLEILKFDLFYFEMCDVFDVFGKLNFQTFQQTINTFKHKFQIFKHFKN